MTVKLVSANVGHRLVLPGYVPVSLNKLVGMHWSRISRIKKTDRDFVTVSFLVSRIPKAHGRRGVTLHVTLTKGQRRCDEDNVWKVLLDSLTHCGAIVDDGPKWLRKDGVVWKRGDRNETVVYLEELPSERSGRRTRAAPGG